LKFNWLAVFGVLFIVLGIAGLAHPNVVMPAKKQEIEIAGSRVIMETRRVVTIPKVLGVLLVVAGGGALFLSQVSPDKRRRRS
jgi:cytochrome bd-type quinol oxidase subunit 2